MKVLLVARKSLIEIAREPQMLGLTLLLPLIFLVVTAFSYSAPLLATYPVLIVDASRQSAPLIRELREQRYADGRPLFDIMLTTDREAAELSLKEQEAAVLITLEDQGSAEDQSLAVTIKGDALYPRFYRASTILESLIRRYSDGLLGRPEIISLVEHPLFGEAPLTSLPATGPRTEFDIYAPGMMIFAWLMIIPQTAMLVAREIRLGTLHRLRLSQLRPGELLGGVALAQMVVALVQVVIVFPAALALGFQNQGSLVIAFIVGLVVSFSAVGLGLLVACFVENDSQAANLGSTISMVQVFLSGSFYQFPPLTLFTLGGHQIDLFDFLPATHGFLALRGVLTYGAGFKEISFRLGAALFLSIIYLGAGVLVFRRLKMRERIQSSGRPYP